MNKQQIGTIKALYRYPVKSMQGESVAKLRLGKFGAIGDRAFALREAEGERVISAKRTTQLLDFKAHYQAEPTTAEPALCITLPDGQILCAATEGTTAVFSTLLNRPVTLERWQPQQQNYGELDANTIFADVPMAKALEGKKRQLAPHADRFDLAPGTFFDSAHLHLLATGTLAHLQHLIGEGAQLDPRRFRPNILIETPSEQTTGFVEDAWLGGTLLVGDTIEIVDLWPTLRCVMTTLPQADLVQDVRILKTAVHHHNNHIGIFAAVGKQGAIKIGDPVFLVK